MASMLFSEKTPFFWEAFEAFAGASLEAQKPQGSEHLIYTCQHLVSDIDSTFSTQAGSRNRMAKTLILVRASALEFQN